jgi:hypothetical protein
MVRHGVPLPGWVIGSKGALLQDSRSQPCLLCIPLLPRGCGLGIAQLIECLLNVTERVSD